MEKTTHKQKDNSHLSSIMAATWEIWTLKQRCQLFLKSKTFFKSFLKKYYFFPLLHNEKLQEDKHSACCFMCHSTLEATLPGSTRNSVIFHFTGAWNTSQQLFTFSPLPILNHTASQTPALILHFAEGNEVEEG